MILEYYVKNHLGVNRKYVKNEMKRMWLMKLTRRSTITSGDEQALKGLGVELKKVEEPKK